MFLTLGKQISGSNQVEKVILRRLGPRSFNVGQLAPYHHSLIKYTHGPLLSFSPVQLSYAAATAEICAEPLPDTARPGILRSTPAAALQSTDTEFDSKAGRVGPFPCHVCGQSPPCRLRPKPEPSLFSARPTTVSAKALLRCIEAPCAPTGVLAFASF